MFKDGEREGKNYRNWAKCSLILVYKHTVLQRTKGRLKKKKTKTPPSFYLISFFVN